MLNNPAPTYVQPIRFAKQAARLKTHLNLAVFPRLQEMLYEKQGEVTVDLHFGQDQDQHYYIRGELTTTFHLQCQRCMQPMDYQLRAEVYLSPLFNDAESKTLPEQYEPLLLQEDKIALVDLVEEELLLNLPLVPKHEEGEC